MNQDVVRVNQNYQPNQTTNFHHQSIHREITNQYIPTTQPQFTTIQQQSFEPQFHKYPIIQSQVRPVYESTQAFSTKI